MEEGLSQSLFYFFGIGAFFYGLLLALLLFIQKSEFAVSNRILASIMILGTWYVTVALLVVSGNFVHVASLFRIGLPTYYLIPPFLYWYVRMRVDKSFRLRPIELLHLIPALLALVDSIPFYMLSSEEKFQRVMEMSKDLRTLLVVRSGVVPDFFHFFVRPVQGVVYSLWTAVLLKDALANPQMRANINAVPRLKVWLIVLLSSIMAIYVGLLANNIVWGILPDSPKNIPSTSMIPSVLSLIFFMVLILFTIANPQLFLDSLPKIKRGTVTIVDDDEEVAFSSEEKDEEAPCSIDAFIREKELFKNPKITAPEIAAMMDMPPHLFSGTINARYGKHFPDFINGYRIEYVIRQFEKGKNDNLSIEGMAQEAGFASRSVFYNAFKKAIGNTPSEYLKNLKD